MEKEKMLEDFNFLFDLINMVEKYDTKYSFVNLERLNAKFNCYLSIIQSHLRDLKRLEFRLYKNNGGKDEVFNKFLEN